MLKGDLDLLDIVNEMKRASAEHPSVLNLKYGVHKRKSPNTKKGGFCDQFSHYNITTRTTEDWTRWYTIAEEQEFFGIQNDFSTKTFINNKVDAQESTPMIVD